MKKHLILLFLLSLFSLTGLFFTLSVQADSYATMIGFNVTDENFTKVKWLDTDYIEVFGQTNDGVKKYGTAMVDIGYYRYTAADEPSGYDFYSVLVRVIMDPEVHTYACGLFNWFTCTDQAYSERLEIYSDLQAYSSGANNTLVQATPETINEGTVYSVGAGVTYSNGQLQYAISGSVQFTENRLDVRGTSDFYNSIYESVYQYNYSGSIFVSMNYLKDPSTQRGVYLIKVPEGQTWVSNKLWITSAFSMFANIGGGGSMRIISLEEQDYYSGDICV